MAGVPNSRDLAGARASFEPHHGKDPMSWHVVNKPGCTQPAGGSRASPSDLWTLRPQPQLLHRSCNKAGVCAPAVKDFATVRNRSAHTTEDAQPRSQTVMTYSEPSPADLESVLEAAP